MSPVSEAYVDVFGASLDQAVSVKAPCYMVSEWLSRYDRSGASKENGFLCVDCEVADVKPIPETQAVDPVRDGCKVAKVVVNGNC
jgi:hypothetical protein